MSGIEPRLTRRLKEYDRDLYAYKSISGTIMIMRQANRLEASDYWQEDVDPALLHPQFIFALTDTGTLQGKPVTWGIEPILARLKGMDIWRNDSWLTERKTRIEAEKKDKERQQKEEFRALAADIRKDFAKATNDINTSTVAKIDNRRLKDGYCK